MNVRIKNSLNNTDILESNRGLFQKLPSVILLEILQSLDLRSIARIIQCSHFFNSNYYLAMLLEKIKFHHYSLKELKNIFNIKIKRLLSLTADFSNTPQELAFNSLPTSSSSQLSSTLLSLVYDHGRSNSFLSEQRYNISLFMGDSYHREAYFDESLLFSLVDMSCILPSKYASIKLIIIDPGQIDLVRLNLLSEGLNLAERLVYWSISSSELKHKQIPLLATHKDNVNQTLHKLGRLGALPSRDLQLKLYNENRFKKNAAEIRELYLECIPIASRFPVSEIDLHTRISINVNFNRKKKSILIQLGSICKMLPKNFDSEQRNFYCQLIINLVNPIRIKTDKFNHHERILALLSLHHIEEIVKSIQIVSYPNFLRSIEAIIDEIILLLILQNSHNKYPTQAISNCIKEFIKDAIGIKPEMATLSSSAMQSISSSLLVCLNYLRSKKESTIYVKIDKSAYFEIFSVMNFLFKVINYEENLCVELTEKNDTYEGKKLNSDLDAIYDLYIGNFESNVLLSSNQLIFTNINAFIENQFLLRESQGKSYKPLLLLLDNTMSNINERFLPTLLRKFKNEIAIGRLCVLVVYSGNKYLHLGTDKVLASLLYGYYNQKVFANLDNEIHQKLMGNPSGSFDTDSPTILLTHAFLKHASNEIFAFSHLIRYRTAYLFEHAVPVVLLEKNKFLSIDSPFYSASNEELASYNKTINNNAGFIAIKSNGNYFYNTDTSQFILHNLRNFVTMLSIYTRDGFGFSQTTKNSFSTTNDFFPECLRISIGTEELDMLIKKIKYVCDYLLIINKAIEDVRANKDLPLSEDLSQVIKEEVNKACIFFLINHNMHNSSVKLEKTPVLANNSATFFSSPNPIDTIRPLTKKSPRNGMS